MKDNKRWIKKAAASIETAIKVITSIVLATLLLLGLYATIEWTVMPEAERQITALANYDTDQDSLLERGPGGYRFDAPSIEELQSTYSFSYYSSVLKAVTDGNAGTIANADVDEDDAVAGLYNDEYGKMNVVLMKDTTETSPFSLEKDMTLNLGGHTLTAAPGGVINAYTAGTVENFAIDGRTSGSKIVSNDCTAHGLFYLSGGNINIDVTGVTFEMNSTNPNAGSPYFSCFLIYNQSSINFVNSTIKMRSSTSRHTFGILTYNEVAAVVNNSVFDIETTGDVNLDQVIPLGVQVSSSLDCRNTTIRCNNKHGVKKTYGVFAISCPEVLISNVDISVKSGLGATQEEKDCDDYSNHFTTVGVYNGSSNMEIRNSHVLADAPYNGDKWSFYYTYGLGANNNYAAEGAQTTIINCDITGLHSGMIIDNLCYVDGGTYRGIGHGGLYVGGANTRVYAKNAEITHGDYYGLSDGLGLNGPALYIGGTDSEDNTNNELYLDNCTLGHMEGRVAIAMRGTDGEHDASLYLSNMTLGATDKIRVDNETLKVYYGENCNIPDDAIQGASNTIGGAPVRENYAILTGEDYSW